MKTTRPSSIGGALLVSALALLALLAPAAHASSCACRDVNDDGVCSAGDIPIADSEWLGGAPFTDLVHTFLVPAGCSQTVTSAPSGGIRVTARRIVFNGEFISTPVGGEGILLGAIEDLVVGPGARIVSGGANKLFTTLLANAALAKSSVALKAGTTCTIEGARLQGEPVTGAGQVGIQCGGDIVIRGSQIIGAGIDIQSMTGTIDGAAEIGGGHLSLLRCDDPAQNPHGNGNGVLDDGDFPCTLAFAASFTSSAQAALNAFCAVPSAIRALNNPLVMISAGDLILGALQGPGSVVEGRFLINLFAENGDVDTRNAFITNAEPPATPPSGARITIVADPASVARLPVLKETATGPFAGTIAADGACYASPAAVTFNGTVVGTPAPAGCTAGGPTGLLPGIGLLCDDPAINPNGNSNGVVDPGDFPCVVTFAGPAAAAAVAAEQFCGATPAPPGPDVKIEKTEAPDPVAAGGTLTYAITVANIGGTTASNVVVTDPLPAGTTFQSCTATSGTCAEAAGVVTASVGSLPAGAAAMITLKVTAPTGALCTTIDNTATVTATGDTNASNNSASASTACDPGGPDVKVEKTDAPDPVAPGGTLTYSITVTNIGGTTASNVVVTDPLPAGTAFQSCTAVPGSCAEAAGIVTASIGALAPGAFATITLKVTAPTGAPLCTTIDNTVTVTATGDINTANNTASASTAYLRPASLMTGGTCASPGPDVKIEKTHAPDRVAAGGTLTYTITVTNIGGTTASNVVVMDPLPAGTTFSSCTATRGRCAQAAGVVTANLGSLDASASATITLKVKAPTGALCATIDNRATVSASGDTDAGNNAASTSVACTRPVAGPDVKITKIDTPDPVPAGGTLTYTITVTNIGGSPATDVVVTDPLPAGTTFQSCTSTIGTCTAAAGKVTAAIGTLAAGEAAIITLQVTAPAGSACKTITNKATVSASGDTSAGNNTASTSTTCTRSAPGPDVRITKVATPDPVKADGLLTYTITVKNVGGSTATSVVVTDPLPAGTTFQSCSSTQGTCTKSGAAVTASIGSLAAGKSASVTLKVAAPASGACTTVENTATVTADVDTDTGNNSATARTACTIVTGGQGCSPGYWKNHTRSWPAPYTSSTKFSAVFEDAFPGKTLLQVASLGGGGLNALGRHLVAALLNAASGVVDYDLTAAQVIGLFDGVYPGGDYEALKDRLAGYNEQRCPLD